MSDKDNSVFNDLEQLIKKTTEANKVFISESTRFYKNLDYQKLQQGNLFEEQKNLVTDAFNAFMKLNIQHASNLIDLGMAISTGISGKDQGKPPAEPTKNPAQPAFVLELNSYPGETAETEFQLNSQKEEAVKCTLEQSPFFDVQDPNVVRNFKTTFSPQSFDLFSGSPQTVKLKVNIPANVRKGAYLGKVNVSGYEGTFFNVALNISPKTKKN